MNLRKAAISLLLAAAGAAAIMAETADDRYRAYIASYSGMAVEQQQAHGIPASVTLAQGLLESAAGRSALAVQGNNHFGIKCHREWSGETMLRSDDAPNECFRVYGSAAESYADHSRFLRRKRYEPLFDLDPSDYAGWARGLSRLGYATDPQYANRLIAIIERYSLYMFDEGASRDAEQTARFIAGSMLQTHPVRRSRGLHYVIAMPGDTYASLAKEFHIKKKRLMACNDVSRDGEIRPWQEVYFEMKHTAGPEGVATATIGEDETMHTLSQRYGIRLSSLRELNPGVPDEPGQRLRLR